MALHARWPAAVQLTAHLFLHSVLGTGIAWRMRKQSTSDFLSSNGTQSGQQKTLTQQTRMQSPSRRKAW